MDRVTAIVVQREEHAGLLLIRVFRHLRSICRMPLMQMGKP